MDDIEYWINQQADADRKLRNLCMQLAEVVSPIWGWGDGNGGHVYQVLINIFLEAGLVSELTLHDLVNGTAPKTRAARLRHTVFERDAYRCKICGDWHDLQVDHVYPKSKGGTDHLDNLQTLCSKCNRTKAAKVPNV